jgi:hypothetical protein
MEPLAPIIPCPYLCPKCSKNPEMHIFNSEYTEYHCSCSRSDSGTDPNTYLTFTIQCQEIGFKEIELFMDSKQEYLQYHWIKHIGWQIKIKNDYIRSSEILGENNNYLTPDEAWNLLLKFNKLLAFL